MNFLSIILSLLSLYICTAQSADPAAYSCNPNSKINGNNQTSRNINSLLDNLVSGTIQRGFISTVQGSDKDSIYGLAQCRGDVSKNDCSTCIKDAAESILKLCPDQSDARIWYDFCFLRYGNSNFFGQVDTSGVYLINVQNVTGDADKFNEKLGALMKRISSQAVGPASKGLGKGKSDVSSFDRLYGLVQCTRDLSELGCAQCASIAIGNLPTVCGDKRGCRVLYSSCYVRYELYPFFFPLEANESLLDDRSVLKYKSVLAFTP